MIDGIVLNSGCAENKTCISSKTYAKKKIFQKGLSKKKETVYLLMQ